MRLFCQVYVIIIMTSDNVLQAENRQLKAEYVPVKNNFSVAESKCNLLGSNSATLGDVKSTRTLLEQTYIGSASWIKAHIRFTPWFSFQGCHLLSSDVFRKSMKSSVNSVSECWEFCKGYSHLALKGENCTCLENGFSSYSLTNCSRDLCPGNENNICGDSGFSKISPLYYVYSIVQYKLPENHSGDQSCVAVFRMTSEYKLFLHPCNEALGGIICKYSMGEHNYIAEKLRWIDAVKRCYDFGAVIAPTTEYVGVHVSSFTIGLTAWIGISRDIQFLFTNGTNAASSGECVAATVSMEGKLEPRRFNCSERLSSLCEPSLMNKNIGLRLILPVIFGTSLLTISIVMVIICIKRKSRKKNHLSSPSMRKLLREDSAVADTRVGSTRVLSSATMNKYEYSEVELPRISVAAGREDSYNELILQRVEELECEVFAKYDHIPHKLNSEEGNTSDKDTNYDHVEFGKE